MIFTSIRGSIATTIGSPTSRDISPGSKKTGSNMKQISSTPLAEGRTAEIFLWDEDHILKLYRDWCPADWVDYESRVAHAIHAAGIPSPAAGEIVEVDGRRGLVYRS